MSRKKLVIDFVNSSEKDMTLASMYESFVNAGHVCQKGEFNHYCKNFTDYEFTPLVKVNKLTTNLGQCKYDQETELTKKTLVVENITDEDLVEENFKPLYTNTKFDELASKRKGVMPNTVYMVTGESGAGKTTVCTNIAIAIKENNPGTTAGFVSCEMDKDDWKEECYDNKSLKQLDTVFMMNYLDASNYVDILIEALGKWNFVILDSFEVVIDQMKEVLGITAKKAESKLINIIRGVASEKNSSIFVIQQYTKGGTYVGSTKIKHMFTGLIYVRFDEFKERYVEFDKNRRCGYMINKKLYFKKSKETGRLFFNDEKFNSDEDKNNFVSKNIEEINKEKELFDQVLETQKNNIQARLDAIAHLSLKQ